MPYHPTNEFCKINFSNILPPISTSSKWFYPSGFPHQNAVRISVLFLECPFILRQTEDNIKMDFVHRCGMDSTGSERDQVVNFCKHKKILDMLKNGCH
jgi:hypothetical protein